CRVEGCAAGCGPLGDDFPVLVQPPPSEQSSLLLLLLRHRHRCNCRHVSLTRHAAPLVPFYSSSFCNNAPAAWQSLSGKALVYLGYAGKSRELQRLAWHTRTLGNSSATPPPLLLLPPSPAASIFPRYFIFAVSLSFRSTLQRV
ncbi:hypothetical protein WN51_00408, partial [Melipona quadrifasciata]